MISIIVSAHNEEKNIKNILRDIKREINIIEEDTELIVGLSGCTDNTESFAKEELLNSKINYKILTTRLGKIKSQKDSLKNVNKESREIVFIDSDIRLKKNAIKSILEEAKKYPGVKLFYSNEIPVKRNEIFYNIINVRTINPEYVIAKEDVSKFHPYSVNKRKKIFATGGMYLLRKGVYDVEESAVGDDSYLTHSVYYRFGFESIKQVEAATIYYQPAYTFSSWIAKWRRIWNDIDRLYNLHPEFIYLKKYMCLRIDFSTLLKRRKYKLMLFFVLERVWNKLGKYILRILPDKRGELWEQLPETREVKVE